MAICWWFLVSRARHRSVSLGGGLAGREPDVAEADGIEMVLQAQRPRLDWIGEREVILHQHVVVIDGDGVRLGDLAVGNFGTLEVNVVALPKDCLDNGYSC
jgi:hypothetical protein